MARDQFGKQLLNFYREWEERINIICDGSRPRGERLAALHWIDKVALGEPKTPVHKLEEVADQLRKERS